MSLQELYSLATKIGAAQQSPIVPELKIEKDISYVSFAGFMIRPTWKRRRLKGKVGWQKLPSYIVEAEHWTRGSRSHPPEHDIMRIGFEEKPEDAIQLILDIIEAEKKQTETDIDVI